MRSSIEKHHVHSSGLLARGLLAAFILVLPACGAEPTEPTLEELIWGSWDWIRAEGRIDGAVLTSATEGFTLRLVLSQPDRLELFKNGELEVATTYEFLPQQDLDDISIPAMLRYGGTVLSVDEHQVVFDLDNLLVLIDPCCDRLVYFWSRTR